MNDREYREMQDYLDAVDAEQWDRIKKLSLAARFNVLGRFSIGLSIIFVLVLLVVFTFSTEEASNWQTYLIMLIPLFMVSIFFSLWYVFKNKRTTRQIEIDKRFIPKCSSYFTELFLSIGAIPAIILLIYWGLSLIKFLLTEPVIVFVLLVIGFIVALYFILFSK